MKKTITKEVEVCDFCGSEDAYYKCLECGVYMCSGCLDEKGVEYKHAVHFSGTGDGTYCKPCDKKLSQSGDDLLHFDYVILSELVIEYNNFMRRLAVKKDGIEKEIEALYKERTSK